jgi:hypothetical protein
MKIAYCPISEDLKAPGDYRRFMGFSLIEKIKFKVLKNSELKYIYDGEFDFIVVTMGSDLSFWAKNQFKKTKIILDCVDSYIFLNNYKIKNFLRAPVKYMIGQHSIFYINYINIIKTIANKSHYIVCSTQRQKQFFSKFCKNVSIILDYHLNFLHTVKSSFDLKKKNEFNLVWEGLPENICHNVFADKIFDFINKYNSNAQNTIKLNLNIITDLYYKRFMNKFLLKNSYNELVKKSKYIKFKEWNKETINQDIIVNDLAIIPLSKNNPLEYGKPANKLYLFFKMGMPTITSNTYAYKEVENKVNLKITFDDINQFNQLLKFYLFKKKNRELYSEISNKYVTDKYPEAFLSKLWRNIFV